MPSLDLLQNGTRVFVITSCGSSARREELVSDLGQRTDNHDWVMPQPAIHNLAEAANCGGVLNSSAAEFHDHALRSFCGVTGQFAHHVSPREIKNPPASCFWRWVFVSR